MKMRKITNQIISIMPYNTAKWCIIHLGKLEWTNAGEEVIYYHRLGDWCACKGDSPLYRNAGLIAWAHEAKCKVRRALMEVYNPVWPKRYTDYFESLK